MSLQQSMIDEESKIDDEESLIDDSKSNLSVNIPKFMQDDKFEPEVVTGEDVLDEGFFTQKFNDSVKLIDKTLDCQVFNGPNQDYKTELKIRRIK
mgnify:CR=1 FL=1